MPSRPTENTDGGGSGGGGWGNPPSDAEDGVVQVCMCAYVKRTGGGRVGRRHTRRATHSTRACQVVSEAEGASRLYSHGHTYIRMCVHHHPPHFLASWVCAPTSPHPTPPPACPIISWPPRCASHLSTTSPTRHTGRCGQPAACQWQRWPRVTPPVRSRGGSEPWRTGSRFCMVCAWQQQWWCVSLSKPSWQHCCGRYCVVHAACFCTTPICFESCLQLACRVTGPHAALSLKTLAHKVEVSE